MSSIPTPRRRALQPPTSYTEDKDAPNIDAEQPSKVKGRVLPFQKDSASGPNANSDLPRPRSIGLARTGSIMKSQSSSIPTTRSSIERKDGMPPPAPPSLIGRSASLRRPIATTGSQDGRSQFGGPSPKTSIPGSRLSSESATKAQSAKTVGLDRSVSSRIPGTPVSKQASGPKPSHSRAQSVNNVPPLQSQGSNLTRPGLMDSTRLRPRSTTTGQALTRGSATVPSAKSVQPGAQFSAQKPTSGAKAASIAPSSTTMARPTFSTLQQHFSPAKSTSKPPLPSSRPISSSEEANSNFETVRQQSELLYLSLLHQDAESTWKSYERSAHAALQREYDSLQHDKETTEREGHLCQEMLNLSALAEWRDSATDGAKATGHDFPEMVRCLSSCLHEVAVFSEPEGRYSSLIREFTTWMQKADAIFNGSDGESGHDFVDALSQEWHECHASLSQRIRLLEREIGLLPPLPDKPSTNLSESTLAGLLHTLRSMTLGMKNELEYVLELERLVLSKETQRVEEAIVKVHSEPIKGRSAQSLAWHL